MKERLNFDKNFTLLSVVLALVSSLGVFLVVQLLGIPRKAQYDFSIFVTVPLFALTILQLVRNTRVQQAGYARDFLQEFRKNDALYSAYYDLVYAYKNDFYDLVCEEIFPQNVAGTFGSVRFPLRTMGDLKWKNEEGFRLYHHRLFSCTKEMTRIDGLLDYFNTVGLYLDKGLLTIEEIDLMLGPYIAVVLDRKSLRDYIESCLEKDAWPYRSLRPYWYLLYLLIRWDIYCSEETIRTTERFWERKLGSIKNGRHGNGTGKITDLPDSKKNDRFAREPSR